MSADGGGVTRRVRATAAVVAVVFFHVGWLLSPFWPMHQP